MNKVLLLILALAALFAAGAVGVEKASAAQPGMIATAEEGTFNPNCTMTQGFAKIDPFVVPGPSCTPSEHFHAAAGQTGIDSNVVIGDESRPSTFVIPGIHSLGLWPAWKYNGVFTGVCLASSNGCGAAAMDKGTAFYYRNPYANDVVVQPFPEGFGMLLKEGQVINGRTINRGDEIIFKCGPGSGTNLPQPPATCSTNVLVDNYLFPSCWNGVDLFKADMSHMSYPVNSHCPAAFPVPLIRVEQFRRSIVPQYQLGAATLNPNLFTLGDHPFDAPGAAHADYGPAFEPATMQEFLTKCINAHVDCGTNPAILRD